MSYIGRGTDAISNVEKLDNITFNGGTTYALTKSSAAFTPVGANNILISIDGVIQQGNFSVSTTNIVFDWSPTSSNTNNFILHYGVGLVNTLGDQVIASANMGANSVDSNSYVDGSIDLAHMSSESVDEDNLHISNAGSNGQALTKQSGNAGGLTWATVTGTTINNNADNRVITGSGTSNTLEGEANLTFTGSALTVTATGTFAGHVTPSANDTYDLGSGSYVWRDIYTGDLNLTNKGKEKGNDIDGTKGSWKIQEGENDLFIMNKVTGKKFKFKLEEVT